jgi:hypothetical protein
MTAIKAENVKFEEMKSDLTNLPELTAKNIHSHTDSFACCSYPNLGRK